MAADNIYTVARPYADAVFESADDANARDGWSNALAALSAIVANKDVSALIASPAVGDAELADAVIGIGGEDFEARHANFVRLLVDNERLRAAPAIAELYEAQRAEAENRLEVEVASAKKLTKKQKEALNEALAERFKREVSVSYINDSGMIGGLIIRAGDTVIDGSLTAQLARMRQRLAN